MSLPEPRHAQDLRRLAAQAVAVFRWARGLHLCYDESSVHRLDRWINRNHRRISPHGVAALGTAIGAFLGECMVRQLGGAWELEDREWAVRLPYRLFDPHRGTDRVFPIRRAVRQLLDGRRASIAALYDAVAGRRAPLCPVGEARVAAAEGGFDTLFADPLPRVYKAMRFPLEEHVRRQARLRWYLGSYGLSPRDQVPDRALLRLARVREAVTRARGLKMRE